MIRKPVTTGFWRGRLPHWEVEEGRYFVTIHLAGAIPSLAEQRIRTTSADLQNYDAQSPSDSGLPLMRTIFREMERWLDRARRNTLFDNSQIAAMVASAIQHRMTIRRWHVFSFVIMPNHVHLFLSVLRGTLKDSVEDFKRWTGHQAAKLIQLPNGRFWQDEWFDHWSRSDEQDERIVRYIERNPQAAGLVTNFRDWRFGSWSP